jgi:hypothetical protein
MESYTTPHRILGVGGLMMNARATISGLALLAAGGAGAQGMPWAKDYASAKEAAAKSGKLIMLDFFTEW